MKKLIIILLLVTSLFSETFEEYKSSVVDDMTYFRENVSPYDYGVIGANIDNMIELSNNSMSTRHLDVLVLVYLMYRINVMNSLYQQGITFKTVEEKGKL